MDESMKYLKNELNTTVFVKHPLASHGSAKNWLKLWILTQMPENGNVLIQIDFN